MHPFFNTKNRLFFLIFSWLLITLCIGGLNSITSNVSLTNSLILYTPLYLLCLTFIQPNYFVCRGLPLRETPWLTLIASHLLTVIAILTMWVLAGKGYARLLNTMIEGNQWVTMFNDSLYINSAIVIIQFEIIVLMHYLFFAMEKTRNLEQDALKQQLLISQAELQTLRATVHPHFLFNSLNTLANIALSAPEQAHRFCLLIAEFLRYSVAYGKKNSASLNDELEHVQNYLGIERERFGDRLQTDFDIDDAIRDTIVPSLILFPIVENAIKHGIDSRIEGGTLSLKARRNDSMLVIEISNPVDELGRKLKGTGHGLPSVERRLKTRYGGEALMKTDRKSGQFTVQLYLPIENELTPQE